MKRKTTTTRYDVAEHLRTPEEMAAYLEACLEEADGDAAFVARALGDIARAKGMSQVAREAGSRVSACTRHFLGSAARTSTPSSRSWAPSDSGCMPRRPTADCRLR